MSRTIDPAKEVWVIFAPFLDKPQKYQGVVVPVNASNADIDARIEEQIRGNAQCDTDDGALVRSLRVYGVTSGQEAANAAKALGLQAVSPELLRRRNDEAMPGTGAENSLKVVYRAWKTAPFRIISVQADATDREIHLHISRQERVPARSVAFLRAPGATDPAGVKDAVQKAGFNYIAPARLLRIAGVFNTEDMTKILEAHKSWIDPEAAKPAGSPADEIRKAFGGIIDELYGAGVKGPEMDRLKRDFGDVFGKGGPKPGR